MVLIEIQRNLSLDVVSNKLLGKHDWKDFLLNPSPEEAERFSRIYYSTYSSGREAQKDGELQARPNSSIVDVIFLGWKRIHVEEKFFKGWSIRNKCVFLQSLIVYE